MLFGPSMDYDSSTTKTSDTARLENATRSGLLFMPKSKRGHHSTKKSGKPKPDHMKPGEKPIRFKPCGKRLKFAPNQILDNQLPI